MKILDRILWYFYLHLCIFSFISDISANRPIQSRDSKSKLNILDPHAWDTFVYSFMD